MNEHDKQVSKETLEAALDGARSDSGEVDPHMLLEVVNTTLEALS